MCQTKVFGFCGVLQQWKDFYFRHYYTKNISVQLIGIIKCFNKFIVVIQIL